MTERYTKKAIREMGFKIIRVGSANLQHLLKDHERFGYSTRAEGWACDYYLIDGLIISTGYDPIGEKIDRSIYSDLEEKARALEWNQKEERQSLLNQFIERIKKVKKC